MSRAKKSKYGSITALMKERLKAEPGMKFDKAEGLVKANFPRSRFNERHLSWYKSALKRGALKGVR